MTGTKTYVAWKAMKSRCMPYSKGRMWYFDKGITVCNVWSESFMSFLKDMGEVPNGKSLDRIDGSKGYFKENCRWATPREQLLNRKPTGPTVFRGVSLNKRGGKPFRALIRVGTRTIHIGLFDSAIEAAIAYDNSALKYRGKEAKLNFNEKTKRI